MSQLSQMQLQPCSSSTPALDMEQINQYLTHLPDWQLINTSDIASLQRSYAFRDFVSAMAFSNQVAELAEQANHHPSILIEWGKVTVTWWTHLIHGLHINDCIMAARCDQQYTDQV